MLLTKAEEFLARAAECERRAKTVTDTTARCYFEELATQWRYLAKLAEQRDGYRAARHRTPRTAAET